MAYIILPYRRWSRCPPRKNSLRWCGGTRLARAARQPAGESKALSGRAVRPVGRGYAPLPHLLPRQCHGSRGL